MATSTATSTSINEPVKLPKFAVRVYDYAGTPRAATYMEANGIWQAIELYTSRYPDFTAVHVLARNGNGVVVSIEYAGIDVSRVMITSATPY